MYRKSKKLPGQLENCDICAKRFTVTTYTVAGPSGGLLCTACSKELAKDTKVAKPKKKATKSKRHLQASNAMDGHKLVGAKSLLQTCLAVCSPALRRHACVSCGSRSTTILELTVYFSHRL